MEIGLPSIEKDSFLIFLVNGLLKTKALVLSGLTFRPHSLHYDSKEEMQFQNT